MIPMIMHLSETSAFDSTREAVSWESNKNHKVGITP